LSRAINRTLKNSRSIAASVNQLEGLGYELSLYLEATVLLSREEDEPRRKRSSTTSKRRRSHKLELSEIDSEYLKRLKITLNPKRSRRTP
jgi:hypothetical protein